MVRAISEACSNEDRDEAIDGYLEIGGTIDAGLMQQVKFDFESLKRATGRAFTREETEKFFAVQQQATRWTYLGSRMTHKLSWRQRSSTRAATEAVVRARPHLGGLRAGRP